MRKEQELPKMELSHVELSSVQWTRGKIIHSLLSLGVPLIVGELGSIAQQFADTMMVGHHSTPELGASGFVNSIFYFVIFLSLGMSYASTPLIGNAYGKGDNVGVVRNFLESIIVNFLIGAFFVLVLLTIFCRIEYFGQPQEIMEYAKPYFLIITASVPFMTLFNSAKQYLDAKGKTQISMWILLMSNVLNIFLNWCLIFGNCGFPEMGLVGAGISTLVSRFMQLFVIVALIFFSKYRRKMSAMYSYWDVRPSIKGIKHQIQLGVPISIQLGLEIAAFNVCGIFMGWLGTVPLAAHQAMFTISTLCFQVLYGIGAADSILISQFRGANQLKNMRRTANMAFFVGLISVITLIAFICLFFDPLASFFTNDAKVIEVMKVILPCFILYQFGDCTQITFANALRGIEQTRPLMFIAFFAYICVSIPLCYFFAFVLDFGSAGVWLGVPFGLSTAGILFYITFNKKIKTV